MPEGALRYTDKDTLADIHNPPKEDEDWSEHTSDETKKRFQEDLKEKVREMNTENGKKKGGKKHEKKDGILGKRKYSQITK